MMAIHRSKVPPHLLFLLLAFVLLGLVGFQTLRQRRLFNEIIKDKDAKIEELEGELQKETQSLEEMHGRIEQLHRHANMLRTDKENLNKQLTDMEIKKRFIEEMHQRLQFVLRDKEIQIMKLKEQENKVSDRETEIEKLNALLEKKESQIKEMKAQLAEFEERKDGIQSHLVGKSNDVRTPELENTANNLDTKEQKIELTGEKEKFESKEASNEKDAEIRKMEMLEKTVLGGNVGSGTPGDIDGLQDRQLEETTEIQRNRTEKKDGTEDENEDINDNLDNLKNSENLEVDIDGKDHEDDEEVEETARTDNEEEPEVDAEVSDRKVDLDDATTLHDNDKVTLK